MKRNDYLNPGTIDGQRELQLFETLPELYLVLSPEKEVLTASDAYLAAMDLSRAAIKNLDLEVVFSLYNTSNPFLSDRIFCALEEAINGKCCRTIDAQYVRHRYYEIIQTPILSSDGQVIYIIHKLLDVSRLLKKEMEFERRIEQDVKRLTDTYDLLSKAEEAGSTGSYQIDLGTQRMSVSDGMYKLLGYEPGAIQPTMDFLKKISYPGDHERIAEILSSAIACKGSYEYTRRIFHPDGEMRYIFTKGKVITDNHGVSIYVLGVAHDLTPMRKAEADLRALQERQKAEIFKTSIRTQEEERRRMAETLRNGIGQLLYAVKINLKHVDDKRALNDPEGFRSAKQYTDKILSEAIAEVRRLSQQMTPAILEDFGLEETIIELCKQFKPDIDLSFSITGLQSRLDADVEVSVYRMVQELLVNVVTHAKASEVIIEIKKEDGSLHILVQDNGIGFNQAEAGRNGLGLATLMNKVRLLNGKITIDANAGTKVVIVLPLEQYVG